MLILIILSICVLIIIGIGFTIWKLTTDKDVSVKKHTKYSKNQWFTYQRLVGALFAAIIITWIISLMAIWYYMDIYKLNTLIVLFIDICVFTLGLFWVYSYFYPSPYWSRYSLLSKKWKTTVDSRNHTEYEKGHYKDAIHWPLSTLTSSNFMKRLHELKYPLLVYDNTGVKAKEWMKRFYELAREHNMQQLDVAYTDAHWTQIPSNCNT